MNERGRLLLLGFGKRRLIPTTGYHYTREDGNREMVYVQGETWLSLVQRVFATKLPHELTRKQRIQLIYVSYTFKWGIE